MFLASERPDPSLLIKAYQYFTSQKEKQQLVNAGQRAVMPLLYSAISILKEKTESKSVEEAVSIAKSLTWGLPRDIFEIVRKVDENIVRATSLNDVVKMARSNEIGAFEVLFDASLHEDLKIRFFSGLVLLEPQKLPPFQLPNSRIKEEGGRLFRFTQTHSDNPEVIIYNTLLLVYSAILHRMGDYFGTESLILVMPELLSDNQRELSVDEFIEEVVKDNARHALFSMCFSESGKAG